MPKKKSTEIVVSNEEKSLVESLIKNKGKNLPAELSESAMFQRVYSLMEYQNLRDVVTAYGDYVDDKGVKSTSLGGFVIQINKHIKACFGHPVDDLRSEDDIELLVLLRKRVARKIANDMCNRIDRKDTKKDVYELIDRLFQGWSKMK